MNDNKAPQGGKNLYIQHLNSDSPKPAREYLLSLGIDNNAVNKLFDTGGTWKYQVKEDVNPFTYTPKDLENKLLENLKPVYDLVSTSLDSMYEHGFNKHDLLHIIDVTHDVRKLLDEADADQKTKIIGIIASVTHDLGNILSRKSHSLLSPLIFKLIFPNFQINKEDWVRVKEAVVYHDEPVIFEEINSWGIINSTEKIEKFKTVFKKETLSLLIADKTRINRKRLSDKAQSSSAIDDNEHIEVNLLGQTDCLVIKKDSALVKFNYHPYANAEEAKNYPQFFRESKHFGFRASVSKDAKILHKFETPIDNFSTWRHKYWKIYSERTFLYIYSLFALFPHIEKVTIQMVDYIYPASTSFEKVEYSVNKNEIEQFERLIKLKYLKRDADVSS